MATTLREFTTEQLRVGETELHLLKGGSGPPCLVLHGIELHEGWLMFHSELAAANTVYAPSHPGFGHTTCPDWITTISHQAVFYNWFLEEHDLRDVTLIGADVGGWIAAMMAVMCPDRLRRLILLAPAGVKPERTESLDVFVTPWKQVIESGFLRGAEAEEYQRIYSAAPITDFGGVREAARTMLMRMCFRPYMYDSALPGMLPKIQTPSLIVWGDQDRIMPLECGEAFASAMPNATLKTIERCGHFVHLDRPRELGELCR
jgi:pimeloyl-ACP methyl ester carboxylesterase